MGQKKRHRDGFDGPTLSFDVAKRQEYLTGFHKRKVARSRKGHVENYEAERKDRMDVKKEIRDDVKRHWKDMQYAERRVDKLFDKALKTKALLNGSVDGSGDGEGPRAIGDARDSDEEGGAWYSDDEDAVVEPTAKKPTSTVDFEAEEDDPFGGCEVTTTGGDGEDLASSLTLALSGQANFGNERLTLAKFRPFETEDQRRIRRANSLREEEKKRLKARERKVSKTIEYNKKLGKKKSKKPTTGKGQTKTKAKARRRRKMK